MLHKFNKIKLFFNFIFMNKLFVRRFAISVILGIVFWLICVKLASGSNPDIWWTPLMWSILYNRFLLWIIIAVVGVHTIHPLFWFKLRPFLRWLFFWILVSIDLADWVFINNSANAVSIFWFTIIAGAIYWLIIDVVASRYAWQWQEILWK